MRPDEHQLKFIRTYLGCTADLAGIRQIQETVDNLVWLACKLDSERASTKVHLLHFDNLKKKMQGGSDGK